MRFRDLLTDWISLPGDIFSICYSLETHQLLLRHCPGHNSQLRTCFVYSGVLKIPIKMLLIQIQQEAVENLERMRREEARSLWSPCPDWTPIKGSLAGCPTVNISNRTFLTQPRRTQREILRRILKLTGRS